MSPASKDLLPLPIQLPTEDGHPAKAPQQRQVQNRLLELADIICRRNGLSRRSFLAGASGMAAAFLALNAVHGPFFTVDLAEAADAGAAADRLRKYRGQFIFDVQTHVVNNRYSRTGILGLRELAKQSGQER